METVKAEAAPPTTTITVPQTATGDSATYSDAYIKVDAKGITIYYYYQPVFAPLFLEWKDILRWEVWPFSAISKAQLGSTLDFRTKLWGLGLTGIWWACDLLRYWEGNHQMVITTTSFVRKGFTCTKPQEICRLMAYYAPEAAKASGYSEKVREDENL